MLLPVFAPCCLRGYCSEVSLWLEPVIHRGFLCLETGAVCLDVITSAGSLKGCTSQILAFILIRPWCQLRRNAVKPQCISGSPDKRHCASWESWPLSLCYQHMPQPAPQTSIAGLTSAPESPMLGVGLVSWLSHPPPGPVQSF